MKFTVVEAVASAGMSYYQDPEGRLSEYGRETFDTPEEAYEFIESSDCIHAEKDDDASLLVRITL